MKNQKVKEIQKRFFSFYVLGVLLDAQINNKQAIEIQIKHLVESFRGDLEKTGLSKAKAHDALTEAATWIRTRGFSIQIISTPELKVPEYYVTFVDELDSDPDVLAMREALSRPSNS